MRVSQNWLQDWVRTDVDADTLADSLSLAGLEVGAVEACTPVSPKVVVGEITGVEAHPKSNKLQICSVDVGRSRPLKIVCGAPNARQGLKSAVALIGADLPGGIKISKARVRDIVSSGMLCSSKELGIDDDGAGIMELDTTARNGTLLNDHLKLDDTVLEIDLTPNRGDCLSVSGVAREVATLHNAAYKIPRMKPVKAESRSRLPIEIKVPEDCPRYVGRVIEGIDLGARTPDWIRERLRRAGHRSISLAVDITNYVMQELGQPMHAFDLDKVNGGIIVRHSGASEEMDLLDGSHVKIPAGTLLITDHSGPVALAGIMGGNDSAISDTTSNILLESACFRAGAIAGRARTMGMHTDASHRFERHVDPELQVTAIQRATQLLIEAAGGTPGPVLDEHYKKALPARKNITLRKSRLELMLGCVIPARQVERIFSRLGMKVRSLSKGWRVSPPSNRPDIQGEHDLIEEIARIYGYDNIPGVDPAATPEQGLRKEEVLPIHRFKSLLVDRDFREVISYSFVEPELQKLIEPGKTGVPLLNPIASNLSVMRTTLLPGLLSSLASNYRRQHRRLRLFESGHVFEGKSGKYREHHRIAAAISGPVSPNSWQGDGRNVDFYDIKGDVESLLQASGCGNKFSFSMDQHPALHPGQSARIQRSGRNVGWIGALHPEVLRYLDVEQPVYVFEIGLESLTESRVPEFSSISRFPATSRDLSIVIDESVSARELTGVIRKSGGVRLVNLELFDVYRGKGVPDGQKSLSYTLTLQDSSSNLTDEEIEEAVTRILTAVNKRVGGALRA